MSADGPSAMLIYFWVKDAKATSRYNEQDDTVVESTRLGSRVDSSSVNAWPHILVTVESQDEVRRHGHSFCLPAHLPYLVLAHSRLAKLHLESFGSEVFGPAMASALMMRSIAPTSRFQVATNARRARLPVRHIVAAGGDSYQVRDVQTQ